MPWMAAQVAGCDGSAMRRLCMITRPLLVQAKLQHKAVSEHPASGSRNAVDSSGLAAQFPIESQTSDNDKALGLLSILLDK